MVWVYMNNDGTFQVVGEIIVYLKSNRCPKGQSYDFTLHVDVNEQVTDDDNKKVKKGDFDLEE